ncbi:MAG: hypothetical protein M3400_10670 [Actinomycetota bacterium]|nr:hypothetical protein [Actinomycetota bacterium]
MTTIELAESEATEEGFNSFALERGWGDGLPLIAPTPERLAAHLRYCPHDPEESIGTVPPANHEATYEAVAANAVMAGCRPEYLPVIVAAVSALLDPAFNLYGLQATTNPGGPLVLIGGPVAEEIDCNGGGNAFGQGWRANATIGRAIRLILNNIGGAKPQVIDRATQGFPGKYSMCVAENRAKTPWPEFHVSRGMEPSESAVSVFSVQGFHNIIDLTSSTARDVLLTMSAGMSAWGTNDMTHGGQPVIVLAPEHANLIAVEGWSKADASRFIFERARFDLGVLPLAAQELMLTRRPQWINPASFPVADSPEDIHVLVAGGPGIHAMYLPSFGASRIITRRLELLDGRSAGSIHDYRQKD